MIKHAVLLSSLLLGLAACAGDTTPQIQAMQRKDKQLSCKEILLEMNEAQFYQKAALKNKGPKLKNILMPLGYISTYMDAQEASDAAIARVEYLDKVYNIMDCDGESRAPGGAAATSSSNAPRVSGIHYQPEPPNHAQNQWAEEPSKSDRRYW
jgi:hypothetical protein